MPQDRDSRYTRLQQVIATEISADLQQKLAEELNLMQNESEIGSVLLNELAATADAIKNIELCVPRFLHRSSNSNCFPLKKFVFLCT